MGVSSVMAAPLERPIHLCWVGSIRWSCPPPHCLYYSTSLYPSSHHPSLLTPPLSHSPPTASFSLPLHFHAWSLPTSAPPI